MKGLLLFVTVLILTSTAFSQAPDAMITVEAISPQEIHDWGWDSPPSTGLKVVGKGELVYLSGKASGGETVTNYTWSLSELPAGSMAMLDSTDTAWTTFIPDTTGQFTVNLSITTASGSAETSVTITSAKYVGVGTIGGLSADVGKGQCGPCHSSTTTGWQETGHATFFERAIDGTASDHYNSSCIECHAVGFDEAPTATNDGFDDVAHRLGWTFPDTLVAGNWADIVTNYPELAHKSNIQCENCHGPGSLHKGAGSIDVTLEEGSCGRCHEEAPYHQINTQWKNSGHSVGVSYAANIPSCTKCHSGYGFIHYVDPDNKLEQTTGFEKVSCQVCHDPHSNALEHQVRKLDDVTLQNGVVVTQGGMGKQCMICHSSRRDAEEYVKEYHDHFGPHHSNQTDMLAGTNAIAFGKEIPSTAHLAILDNGCVSCHMAETPAAEEPGNLKLGGHSFAMHWDGDTPDEPNDDVDHVKMCQTCHGMIDSFDDIQAKNDYDGDGNVESTKAEIHGMLDNVGMLLPPVGDPAVTVDSTFNPLQLKAAYNHAFVHDDASYGAHNFKYAINLLQITHDTLSTATSVTPENVVSAPRDFSLAQNYPNPFNPSTVIRFGLPRAEEVKLVIFNVLGQPVRTLVNGKQAVGYHNITWDGRDDEGNIVGPGMYIYNLRSKSISLNRKMLLIK